MSEPPVLAYHRRSKNRPGRPAAAPRRLDRSIEPVPFRRYRGAALLTLPEIPPVDGPAWGELFILGAVAPAPLDREAVARLFFDSLAISAWREEAGARFSFRVNPSAGNLHPTEAYLLAGPLPGLHDRAALYHYSPFDHALEIRADLPDGGVPPGTLLLGFTSILWRTAWKYGERAFRLARLDAGHALAAVTWAAAALGWEARRVEIGDAALARLLGVAAQEGPEREEPVALLALGAPPDARPGPPGDGGRPNRISPGHRSWPALEAVTAATRHPGAERQAAPGAETARAVLRGRRSPAAFAGAVGAEEISRVFAGGLSRPFVQRPLLRVERLLPGDGVDLRRLAGHQSFAAGASCLAVLLGDLEPALAPGGAWLYRRLHEEAGAIGHALSLEAAAQGLGARGIGGFLDDEVLAALGLPAEGRWQALYLLAVGRPA